MSLKINSNVEKWTVSGAAAGAIGGLWIMLSAVDPSGDTEAGTAAQVVPWLGRNGESGIAVAGSY